jgi:DNA-binding MarR family transcriptional regulator
MSAAAGQVRIDAKPFGGYPWRMSSRRQTPGNGDGLADVLERLCNLLRGEARAVGGTHGLLPVQLAALRYLSQCNRYSNTVLGLSEFLGQTKGTVSQSVKVLERRGLVRKEGDPSDRRVVHLEVTPAGHSVLGQLAEGPLAAAIQQLGEARHRELVEALTEVLRAAQQANDGKSFGVCRTCRYNEPLERGARCALTGESLSGSDVEAICREHRLPDGQPEEC